MSRPAAGAVPPDPSGVPAPAGPTLARTDLLLAAAIALGTFGLLLATLRDPGMTWDEGFTVEREERLVEWFGRVLGGDPPRAWAPLTSNLESRAHYLREAGASAASPWSRASLRFYWPFAREEPNGHPPFYALLGLAGRALSGRWLGPLEAYRVGPAVLFAATAGALYILLARPYGRGAGLLSSLALVTMPRVFAHAHFASYDGPLLCLWLLAAQAFERASVPGRGARRGLLWTLAFGLAWGCAAATKLGGWFLPIPLAAWVGLYRDRRAARVLVLGGLAAAFVLWGLIPTWWREPIEGVRVFLVSNLSREQRSPIPVLFLGRVYAFALPWYNTMVWTAIVVPPATLALALLGFVRALRNWRRERLGMLLALCWAFWMALRALPGAPGHDGIRQFLPAFGFLAALAGIGLAGLGAALARRLGPKVGWAMITAVILVVVGASTRDTYRYHPLQLSYYSPLVGGLEGAARAGMEPTYYWDALTPEVRAWLDTHTTPQEAIAFAYPIPTFEYLHHWGLLRPHGLPTTGHPARWYVVQNRPGILQAYPNLAIAAALLRDARPAYSRTLPGAPRVPLVAVYTIEQALAVERALNAVEGTGPAGPR